MDSAATKLDLGERNAGDEIVLRGATLSGQSESSATALLLDLVDCELSGIDLSGMDLTGSRFKNTKFVSCVFDRCRFDEVSIVGCDFTSSSFVGLQLSKSRMANCAVTGSKLVAASIFRTTLDACTFQETSMRGAKFYEVTTKGVCLWSCDLQEATFSDIVVEEQLDLRGSSIGDSHGLATVRNLLVDHTQGAALADWLLAQHRIEVSDLDWSEALPS